MNKSDAVFEDIVLLQMVDMQLLIQNLKTCCKGLLTLSDCFQLHKSSPTLFRGSRPPVWEAKLMDHFQRVFKGQIDSLKIQSVYVYSHFVITF